MTFSNANMLFLKWEFISNSYTIAKTPPTTKQIKSINKKKFAKIVLNKESKTFVVHIAALKVLLTRIFIYSSLKPQIAFLNQKKALTTVQAKYLDFLNVSSVEKVLVLPKQTKLNEYAIK